MIHNMTAGAMIKQINDELEKQANNALRPLGLTMAQVGVLIALREEPNHELTLKQLEYILHVAQSTCAGIVMRLEAKELIASAISETDHRIKVVRLTSKGEDLLADADYHMQQAENSILASLNKQEQETLLSLLGKVRNSLR